MVFDLGPVPVRVKSEVTSTRRGDWAALAMFDFGESRTLVRAIERDSLDVKLPVKRGSPESSRCRVGVKGEATLKSSVRAPEFLARGEGESGNRPPATFVEKILGWLLRGVHTEVVAILKCAEGQVNALHGLLFFVSVEYEGLVLGRSINNSPSPDYCCLGASSL